MLEESVKLSGLIIFYFISNFLIYAPILPNREIKIKIQLQVLSFLEQFFSSSTVFRSQKQMCCKRQPLRFFGAEPNFAPFRWRIWLAPSEFLCLSANQNVTFVTLFCTQLPFFCTMLSKNCIALSQSQSRNFFTYITYFGRWFFHRAPTQYVCVADCYLKVNVLDVPFASPIAIYR